mmetsp:Transcript_53490/g.61308  ORF Transcript_53490/g.61308 Transcript_53490/m.61308 type:complete len:432 (-) Transcript_53490:173-1468(-)
MYSRKPAIFLFIVFGVLALVCFSKETKNHLFRGPDFFTEGFISETRDFLVAPSENQSSGLIHLESGTVHIATPEIHRLQRTTFPFARGDERYWMIAKESQGHSLIFADLSFKVLMQFKNDTILKKLQDARIATINPSNVMFYTAKYALHLQFPEEGDSATYTTWDWEEEAIKHVIGLDGKYAGVFSHRSYTLYAEFDSFDNLPADLYVLESQFEPKSIVTVQGRSVILGDQNGTIAIYMPKIVQGQKVMRTFEAPGNIDIDSLKLVLCSGFVIYSDNYIFKLDAGLSSSWTQEISYGHHSSVTSADVFCKNDQELVIVFTINKTKHELLFLDVTQAVEIGDNNSEIRIQKIQNPIGYPSSRVFTSHDFKKTPTRRSPTFDEEATVDSFHLEKIGELELIGTDADMDNNDQVDETGHSLSEGETDFLQYFGS